MSDAVNPYQSPETSAVTEKPGISQGNITETMLIYLKEASPWLRFIGILGFIGCGMTAIWGVFLIVLIPIFGQVWESVPGFEAFCAFGGAMGLAFGGIFGVLIIGSSLLIFFPSLFVYRFGDKIRTYLRSGTDRDLEQALKNNKSLWKFYGIICIVYLAFVPVMVVFSIIAGVASVLF